MKFKESLRQLNEEKRNLPRYLRDDDNFRFEVSNLIMDARVHSGLTQEGLAKLIKTKQPSVARWEAAESLPSLRTLKNIADALDTYLIPPKFGFTVITEGSEAKQQGTPGMSFYPMNTATGAIFTCNLDSIAEDLENKIEVNEMSEEEMNV